MNASDKSDSTPRTDAANTEHQLLHAMPLGVCIFGNDYVVRFWNRCLESWTKLPASQVEGRDLREVFPHLAQPKYTSRFETLFHRGPPVIFSVQLHGSIIPSTLPGGGGPRLQHSVARSIQWADSSEYVILLTMQDATEVHNRIRDYAQMRDQALQELEERKRAEAALRDSQERLASISNTAFDAIVMVSEAGSIEFWNPSAERIFGLMSSEALGNDLTELIVPEKNREMVRNIMRLTCPLNEADTCHGLQEFTGKRKNGEEFPVECYVASFGQGEKKHTVATLRDISQRKKTEARLQELATIDSLTGLSNRRHFLSQAHAEFERARRYNVPLAILMVDVDYFKNVNDTYGHEIGDRVLMVLAETFHKCLRTIDIVGRLGGEEFAVVLPEASKEGALQAAERIRSAVEASHVETETAACSITVSIGVVTLEPEVPDGNALIRNADAALYEAKRLGRNRVVLYRAEAD